MEHFKIFSYSIAILMLSTGGVSYLTTGSTLPDDVLSQIHSSMGSSSAIFDLDLAQPKGPYYEWFGVDSYPRMFQTRRRRARPFNWKKSGKAGKRGILGKVVSGVGYLVKKGITATIKIGGAIIMPPLRGVEKTVNLLHSVAHIGAKLKDKLINETRKMIKSGWERVKSVDFPGKKTMVLLFPTGLVSVVDYGLNTTWYLTSLPGKTIIASKAWALYMAVKVVSATLKPAIETLHIQCVYIPGNKIEVKKGMVDEMDFRESNVCGWANLAAVNNVTIKADGRIFQASSFLVVKVPYLLENIKIKFKNVNVTGMGMAIIENTPLTVRIQRIKVNSEISFNTGTVLQFMTIKLRVEGMDGFNITFNSKGGKSFLEETVEAMGDVVGKVVTKTVNNKFRKFEEKISKFIKGK